MSTTAMAAAALRYEAAMWRSLYAWIARRPRSARPDDLLFGYDKAAAPIIWAFVALNFIEIPAVHFLIPWFWARIALIVVGVWGTVWMVGVVAAVKVNPHVVGVDGIRVRKGFTVDLAIPWDAVRSVSSGVQGSQSTRQIHVDGGRVSLLVTGQTNVTIHLNHSIPQVISGRAVDVTEIRLFADDSAAMARACRVRLVDDAEETKAHPS